jgi:hypothetical protein
MSWGKKIAKRVNAAYRCSRSLGVIRVTENSKALSTWWLARVIGMYALEIPV